MPTPIRRVGAPTETRWMIYGSYVLDVIFGESCARDLDVGFDPALRHPTGEEVRRRLAELSFPNPPQTVQFTRCHDFTVPEAGGFPCFNIDFWQIHMDGQLYVADPCNRVHYSLDDQVPTVLVVVDQDCLTRDRAEAGIDKLERYSALRTDETEALLTARLRLG